MGSVGGKTPTEPKPYKFSSNLWHIEQDEIDMPCSLYGWQDQKDEHECIM